MNALFKTVLIAGVLAVAVMASPSSAVADHNPYWRGYWGWYDNTYQPYYNNYYGPSYGGYYGPTYGYRSNYYYAPPTYGGYYGGYYAPGPNVDIRVGRGRDRVSFGWW